jgi:hypothetical protein
MNAGDLAAMWEFIAFLMAALAGIVVLTLAFDLKPNTFAGLGTALATVILALATIYLAWNADKQIAVMETDQRAFVYAERVAWHKVQKEEAQNLMLMGLLGYGKNVRNIVEITVVLQNSGRSEPTDLLVQIACPTPDRKVDDPFDLFNWEEQKAAPEFLGPSQTKEIGPCAELSATDVTANAMGLAPRYVLGEIRYHDVFNSDRPHVTQFAMGLRFFGEDLDNLAGRAVSVGRHNCTDTACPKR